MADNDRYDVNPLDDPAAFAEELRDIKRRIAALEGAPMVGSNMTAVDGTGRAQVIVGKLPDGSYGLLVQSVDPNDTGPVFRVDNAGSAPQFALPIRDPSAVKNVTSDLGVTAWSASAPSLSLPGLVGSIAYSLPVGTTGELYIEGVTDSNVRALTSGSGSVHVHWLHGITLPRTTPIDFNIEVRRTSGAGTIGIFQPWLYLAGPEGCSATVGLS